MTARPSLPPVGSIITTEMPDDFKARVVGVDEVRRRVFLIPDDPASIRDFARGFLPPAPFEFKN